MTEATTTAPARAVALAPTAAGQIQSANEMVDALKAVQAAIAPDLNPSELKLFAMVAYRSGLDPFARQIYAIKRKGRVTFQTGIDGFRSSAERTGTYDGSDEPVFGPTCSCSEVPKPHPEFAQVTVYRIRDGVRKGQSATAHWHEFKPAPGQSGNEDHMWKKMPRNQLAKCAEALAFRRLFPHVLGGIYTDDEMAQAGGPVVLEHRQTARETVAARRAEAEAADQGGTDATTDQAATEASDAADVGGFGPAAAGAIDDQDDVAEGEVREIDEAGAPAVDVVAKLQEHVAASGMKGKVTPAQQKRVGAIASIVGGGAALQGVVVAAFGDDAWLEPTAAQAQAIINFADSFGGDDAALVAAWTAAAGGGA